MEVPRITIEELKSIMEAGKPITIIDVRKPEAYAGSNKKITGAVYLDPLNDARIKEFAKGLDKSGLVVTY